MAAPRLVIYANTYCSLMIESLMAASTLSDLKSKGRRRRRSEAKHSRAQTYFLQFLYIIYIFSVHLFLKGPIPSHFSSSLFSLLASLRIHLSFSFVYHHHKKK